MINLQHVADIFGGVYVKVNSFEEIVKLKKQYNFKGKLWDHLVENPFPLWIGLEAIRAKGMGYEHIWVANDQMGKDYIKKNNFRSYSYEDISSKDFALIEAIEQIKEEIYGDQIKLQNPCDEIPIARRL